MIVRWSLRILVVLFLTFVVSTGIAFWVATRTSILEEQVNAWLDSFLSSQLPLAVSIGDIGGEPWHHLRLTDVRVDEIAGDSLRPLVHIDTLEVEYLWRQVLGRQWHLSRALVAGVTGRYGPYPTGRPGWLPVRDSTQPARPLRLPQITVDQLDLRNVDLNVFAGDSIRLQLDHAQSAFSISNERISIDASLSSLKLDGERNLTVDTLAARVVGFGNEWFAENLVLGFDSTRVSGTAHLDLEPGLLAQATLQLDPVRWNDLARFANADLPGGGSVSAQLEYSGGVLSGRGTVKGDILQRQLEGLGVSFQFDQGVIHFDTLFGEALGAQLAGRGRLDIRSRPIAYGLQANLQAFDLQRLVLGGMKSDLSGRFDVSGHGTTRASLRVDVVADSAYGSLGPMEFTRATGALTVTTDSLYLHPGFRARYKDVDASFAGAMAFADRMAVTGDLQAADVETLVDYLGYPGTHAQAIGRFVLNDKTTDPTLTFDVQLDSVQYKNLSSGAGRMMARLARAFQAASGRVSTWLSPVYAGPLNLDSAYFSVNVSPEWLRFDTVRAFRQGDTARATVDFDRRGRNLTVQSLNATVLRRPVSIPWPSELYVGADTLFVHHVSVSQDSGSVTCQGWIEYGGTMRLTLAAADARVGPWLRLFYPTWTLDGKLFAELEVRGKTADPQIGYQLRLQNTVYDRFPLGDLTATGEVTPRHLRLDSVLLQTGDGAYRASGELPLTEGDGAWKPDRTGPLSGRLEAEGEGLRVLAIVLPEVESLYGDVSGSLNVSGTLDDPVFSGHFSLWDGNLKVWSLREHFSPVQIEVSLQDSVATIREAHLRVQGDPHDIAVSGRLIFHGLTDLEYDLGVKGLDVPLSYEYADFTGRFDLDVTARGDAPPLVGGKIKVREAYYRDPLEATDSLARLAARVEPDTASWNVNIDVGIANNAWVKNDDINAEFSGNVRVIRQEGQWNYLGTLEPLRGSYYLYGRKFRNLRGSITFDDVHEVDPTLDLEADVNLPIADSSHSTDGSVLSYQEVTVKVQGRLSEPQIIPPAWLGESNFIRALYPLDNPESAAEGAAGFVTGEIERLGTRTLGVETFELRPSETGRYDWADARLRIGTYLLPDIYVYGGTGFDPSQGTEVGFEYRLKNWLRLQGHRSFDNLYQFDINLKWEADK
jgi:autotransporter translocation and assembly factor TamB